MNTPEINKDPVACYAVPQESIYDYAEKVFELVQKGTPVHAKFNKIEFVVTLDKFENPKAIIKYYFSENQLREEERKRSPDYKERAKQFKEQIKYEQKQAKEEQKKLLNLSPEKHWEIVEWIEKNRKTVYYMEKDKVLTHLKAILNNSNYNVPNNHEYQNHIENAEQQKIFEYIVCYAQNQLIEFNLISFHILNYIKDWKNCEK